MMSTSRLYKQLARPLPEFHGSPKYKPILLSDSKGMALQKCVENVSPEQHIVFSCRPGAKTGEQYQWFYDLLESNPVQNKYHCYVWCGTCDLTSKNGKYITLRNRNDESIERVLDTFDKFDKLCGVRHIPITFLEIPHYSIVQWNKAHGHPSPHQFTVDDKLLSDQVSMLNSEIRDYNADNNSYPSPKFSLDLENNRKSKGKPSQYYLNWNLYRDGLHPKDLLSQVWLQRLSSHIIRSCYIR